MLKYHSINFNFQYIWKKLIFMNIKKKSNMPILKNRKLVDFPFLFFFSEKKKLTLSGRFKSRKRSHFEQSPRCSRHPLQTCLTMCSHQLSSPYICFPDASLQTCAHALFYVISFDKLIIYSLSYRNKFIFNNYKLYTFNYK